MNVLMKNCVALWGGVTTHMGVTGACVKMDTPITERKGPRVHVSSLHPICWETRAPWHHIQHVRTPLVAPLAFQLSSSLVHLGKAAGSSHKRTFISSCSFSSLACFEVSVGMTPQKAEKNPLSFICSPSSCFVSACQLPVMRIKQYLAFNRDREIALNYLNFCFFLM